MANTENLKREVKKLCEVLNNNGFRMPPYNIPWQAGSDPRSTFGGGIAFDINAFTFLKSNGYLHNRICWKCGNETSSSNHSFTNSAYNSNVTYNICNSCFTKGKNFKKTMNPDETSSNCYIATVCYGDINSNEVELFRKFRDKKLSKHRIGKLFIKYYYKYSPTISERLNNKKNANFLIKKIILNPILRFIK